MLQRMHDLPAGIDGLKAIGTISKQDYDVVAEPLFDEARRSGRRLRFLYEIGPEFERFTAGAAWEDARLGLRSLRAFDGCALVTDIHWIRQAAKLAAFLVPCPVRVFGNAERAAAIEWLRSLPQGAGVTHRLLTDVGVLVVEVKQPLRASDFDAVAATVDGWIDTHGGLAGLVLHARTFPVWENLSGMIRHLRFVRDHHHSVRRVAVATDDESIANFAPHLSEHFIQAKIESFGYGDLDRAIAWASGATAPTAKGPSSASSGTARDSLDPRAR